MIALALAFLGTALLYASVGFGGGSTYSALLVLAHTDLPAVPTISLLCNLLVVTLGSWRFARAGNVPWRRIWPMFTLSVPMAWIGARTPVSEVVFIGLLAASLLVAGLTMLWRYEPVTVASQRPLSWFEPAIGGALGLLAGIVGIGGGIFLAPLLHVTRWDQPKAIAGTCAVFILVNSVAGLFGQWAKVGTSDLLGTVTAHWLLFPAVAAGGFVGSLLGSSRLQARHVAILTAVLVLYVGGQLSWRFVGMVGGTGE